MDWARRAAREGGSELIFFLFRKLIYNTFKLNGFKGRARVAGVRQSAGSLFA